MVNTCRVEPNYSCFRPFMGHSQIIIRKRPFYKKNLIPDSSKNSTLVLKNSPNIWYSSRHSTRYSTRYSTRGRVTLPQSNNFTIRLRLDLGHQLLVFASMTNLELGPCLANTWVSYLYVTRIKTLKKLRHFVFFRKILPCVNGLYKFFFEIPKKSRTHQRVFKWILNVKTSLALDWNEKKKPP